LLADNGSDEVTHVAMSSLTKLLAKLEEVHVRDVLLSLCIKILPCYELEDATVRAAAFTLFHTLVRFYDGPSRECLLSQCNHMLVPVLIHINDQDEQVKLACKRALKGVISLMPSTAAATDDVSVEGRSPAHVLVTLLMYVSTNCSCMQRAVSAANCYSAVWRRHFTPSMRHGVLPATRGRCIFFLQTQLHA
jgi:hypothetical protein